MQASKATHIFALRDRTLRFDAREDGDVHEGDDHDDRQDPPQYIANFNTRTYPVVVGGQYTAIVYDDGVPIGTVGFVVADKGSRSDHEKTTTGVRTP
ncbi:MAG: hypothetical protein V1790_09855 [Planctomycetota bacterium]